MRIGEVATVTPGMATTKRAAGARAGQWRLDVVESGDIEDDRLHLGGLRRIEVWRTAWAEKHPLRPFDLLITARSRVVKVALVPPGTTGTVAASTLLVVRPSEPGSGIGQYLWYYLTSTRGRGALEAGVRIGASIPSLSASAVAELEIPLPPPAELRSLARMIEASEETYQASVRAVELRRETLRDAVIDRLASEHADGEEKK
ncbi:MAG: hypothetical protein R3B59_09835 [Dehalococcoidia bacterium]